MLRADPPLPEPGAPEPFIPYNWTIRMVFTRPVLLEDALSYFFINTNGTSYVGRSALHSVRQTGPVTIELDAVANQNSIVQTLLLPRGEALIDAKNGAPVATRESWKTLSVLHRYIVVSNVYISERVMSLSSPETLCIEDDLILTYDESDGGLLLGEVEFHRLLSNETVVVPASHPCIEITVSSFITVRFHLRHCYPGIQIAESYELRITKPILHIRNQYVVEPVPIQVRVVGCRCRGGS